MGRFRDFVDFVLAWFFPTGLNVTDQRFALFAPLGRERESKGRATWEEWTPRVRLAWGGHCLLIQRQRPEWKQTTFPCDFWRKKKKKKSLAENTTAQVGIIIAERKGARLRKEN